jgi:hypothetical protein
MEMLLNALQERFLDLIQALVAPVPVPLTLEQGLVAAALVQQARGAQMDE